LFFFGGGIDGDTHNYLFHNRLKEAKGLLITHSSLLINPYAPARANP
jgi:hypothetical protein